MAARQKLHVIKQTEEEGIEECLQRVLTTAMDGFHVANNTTVQKLATEVFLRGCRHKEAASLTLNQNPMSIQEACRSVKTILANKKAIFGNNVTFQERYFTAQEEERVSNIDRKVYNLDRDFRGASISSSMDSHTSAHRRDSPYPSQHRHSYNDSRPSNVRDDQEGMQLRGRPRMRDSRLYQGRPEYGSRPGHSPGMERNYRDRYYSPGYSRSPNYRYPGRNLSPYRERYYNGGDRDKYSHRSDHGRPSSYDKPVHIPTQNYRGTTSPSYGRPNRDDSHRHHIPLPSERDMLLTVNILLNGVHTESVLDTAAMVTLVREDYFNEINFTGESGPTCNLTGINNDPIKGKIIKKVPITIGGCTFLHSVCIAPIKDRCLLGVDFLKVTGSIIDLSNDTLDVNGEKVSIKVVRSPEMQASNIIVVKPTVVQQHLDCIINKSTLEQETHCEVEGQDLPPHLQAMFESNISELSVEQKSEFKNLLSQLVLRGMTWEEVIVYLDDIIVIATDFTGMIVSLKKVFMRFREHNMKLKPRKCNFFKRDVEFLGKLVSGEGIRISPDKVDAVKNWPIPTNAKQVMSYLGFMNYHRSHTPNFGELSASLYTLSNAKKFVWNEEHQYSFDKLKDLVVSARILAHPTPDGLFVLDTDASDNQIAASLSQMQNGILKPIAFASFKNVQGQLARWLEELSQYDFRIQHRAGKDHVNADRLGQKKNMCVYYLMKI